MRMLFLAGSLIVAGPALAQQTVVQTPAGTTVMMHGAHGQVSGGRWWGGSQAHGGWSAYRRPASGFILPGYWMQPRFYIANWGYFGLPAPMAGYGWSRYYDDVVLTDRYGKVYDSRYAYDWSRYGDYERGSGAEPVRDNTGRIITGAVIGGLGGGLIGSAIAGPGDRTAGAIIGGGLGAMTGAVIADSSAPSRSDRYVGPGYSYEGRYGPEMSRNERKLAREAARQRAKLDKMARKAGFPTYDAYLRARTPAYAQGPHWAVRGGPEGPMPHVAGQPNVTSYTEPGYIRGGWYYPGATVTTVTLQPTVTTTRTYVTTVVKAKASRPAGKIIKRKVVRTRCRCG